jgi:1D-myo-inositol-tetrakisphosphate 5-kinase/inositol-polyphosphate multikinase
MPPPASQSPPPHGAAGAEEACPARPDPPPQPQTPRASPQSSPARSDGSLADPTGALFIKPCTAAEAAFYEDAARLHPRLAALMPRHLGTLELAPPALAAAAAAASSAPQEPNPLDPAAAPATMTARPDQDSAVAGGDSQRNAPQQQVDEAQQQPLRLKGLPLRTSTHLVLANAAAGLARPSVLDVKLGARLWAPDAPAAKRARLDAVSESSTSSSLGFRIAGMRVWLGDDEEGGRGDREEPGQAASAGGEAAARPAAEACGDEYSRYERATNTRFFHKLYGRRFSAHDVVDGLREFVRPTTSSSRRGLLDARMAARVASLFLDGVRDALRVLEATELRVFSSSLLFAYEADARAFADKERALAERAARDCCAGVGREQQDAGRHADADEEADDAENDEEDLDDEDEEDDDDDDDDEEEEELTLATVKLIDFAHARFAPGEGPDENVLRGVRSLARVLEQLAAELQAQAEAEAEAQAPR